MDSYQQRLVNRWLRVGLPALAILALLMGLIWYALDSIKIYSGSAILPKEPTDFERAVCAEVIPVHPMRTTLMAAPDGLYWKWTENGKEKIKWCLRGRRV